MLRIRLNDYIDWFDRDTATMIGEDHFLNDRHHAQLFFTSRGNWIKRYWEGNRDVPCAEGEFHRYSVNEAAHWLLDHDFEIENLPIRARQQIYWALARTEI